MSILIPSCSACCLRAARTSGPFPQRFISQSGPWLSPSQWRPKGLLIFNLLIHGFNADTSRTWGLFPQLLCNTPAPPGLGSGPTRYPDSYPEGTPGEHFGKMQSEQAHLHAGAVVEWVSAAAGQSLGVFGSYGRGTAAVGSDLDLLLILKTCDQPIWERLRCWDTGALPQWNPRLAQVLQEETHWLTATPPPFNQPPAQTDGRRDP